MRITELAEWPNSSFGNWGRWDNFKGTLNLLTPDVVSGAIPSVQTGRVLSIGHQLTAEQYPPELAELHGFSDLGFTQTMLSAATFSAERQAAADRIAISNHSLKNTHIDALSHVGHKGKGFNGVDFDEMVSVEDGAATGAVTEIAGIVTRGVLADIPRLRGVDYLTPGDWVRVEELEAAAPEARPGDALLVRTGRWKAPEVWPGDPGSSGDIHGDWAALHVDCMSFVAERDIAVVGTDSTGDTFPLPTPHLPTIHILAEVYLGLPLVHSLELDELADACAARGRNDFLFIVAPLKVPRGTGSPVNPLCVL